MQLERMKAWNGGPARVTVLGLTIQKGFVQLRESIEPRLSLARPGISIYIVLDYFLSFIEFVVYHLVSLFEVWRTRCRA